MIVSASMASHLASGHDLALAVVCVLGGTHSDLCVAGAVLGALVDVGGADDDIIIIHNHHLGVHLHIQWCRIRYLRMVELSPGCDCTFTPKQQARS